MDDEKEYSTMEIIEKLKNALDNGYYLLTLEDIEELLAEIDEGV